MEKELNNEEVTLPKKEFEALLKRIEKIEGQNQATKLKRSKEHKAVMREWDGKLVTKVVRVYENTRPTHEDERMQMEVELWDGKKFEPATLNYLPFLNLADRVQVLIKDYNKNEHTETDPRLGGGGIADKVSDKTDRFTGEQVELEVTYIDIRPTVVVLDGNYVNKEINLDGSALNL